MASKTWFGFLESTIFSRVSQGLTTEYGDTLNCTMDEINGIPAEFPTMELLELEPVEIGQDLSNETVNAVRETIQIRLFAQDKETLKRLCRLATVEMKKLRFNVTAMFFVRQVDADVYFAAGRFRRVIGGDDRDIVIN